MTRPALALWTAVLLSAPSLAPGQSLDRVAAWRADLTTFSTRFERLHHDLYAHVSREAWTTRVEDLSARIPDLADHEIVVELMRLAAAVGDGHTVVAPPFDGPLRFHAYPVAFYRFDDGLFVRAAREDHADLVGARVVRLGGVEADALVDRVAEVFPHDNEIGLLWGLEMTLPIAEVLHGLGIADRPDRVEIVVEDASGERRRRVLEAPEPLTGQALATALFTGDHPGWETMRDDSVPAPAWRRDLEVPYRYETLEDGRVIHVLFNQVRNGDVPFEAFLDELFDLVERLEPAALILDLRTNEGGDLTMLTPLITGLIRTGLDRERKLYVITGRRTFSAAGYLVARLDVYTDAVFVGEPPATSPNFVGESSDPFRLPHSGVLVNPSTLAWQGTFAFDDRSFVEPDLPVGLTSADERAGRDPALEAILARVGDGE